MSVRVGLVGVGVLAVVALVLAVVAPLVRAQQECPNPQLIDTVTGNGDQQSAPFDTSTSLLRISYNVQAARNTVPFFASLEDATDPEAPSLGDVSTQGTDSGQSFINAPPGRYYLDISTTDAQYTIKIEGCGEGAQANPSEGTNITGPPTGAKTNPPPKATPPSPTPPPAPTPQPKASPPPPGQLMSAGGPTDGPVPEMPGGGCPKELPNLRGNACYR